ncbi:MAG TPA: two-component regulator propeller domain-containing protein [Chryseolinea sp.]
MKFLACYILLASCLCGKLHAQQSVTQRLNESRHFYMRDGLSDEGITSLVQDSLGFIWVGTQSGLNKFDGYNFTSYQNDPTSRNSLANNVIRALWYDDVGRIWIGHDEGLDIFDPKTESFFFHWVGPPDQKEGASIYVWNFVERKDGKVWICTNRGLYFADPTTFHIEKFSALPEDLIYRSVTDAPDGSLWLATDDGLFHFEPKTQRIDKYLHEPKDAKSISNSLVRCVFFDKQQRMWVGTYRGLNLYDASSNKFTRYMTQLDILNLFEPPGRKLWIATEYGVDEFDPDTGLALSITGGYYTWAVKEDKQGIVWLPTLHGLHQINPKRKQFTTYTHLNNNIGYIVEDHDNNIWMSTFTGLYRFDQNMANVYQHIKVDPGLSKLVGGIFLDKKGFIWLASKKKIEKLDLTSGVSDSLLLNSPNPSALLVDSHGDIWVGNYTDIMKYDIETKTYKSVDQLPKTCYYFLLEDSHQNIWMCTSVGLLRYNLNSTKLDIFRNVPGNPKSLSNNVVYHVLQDENETMWVATDGGLNKMARGSENKMPEFRHWRTSNSNLHNNNVYHLIDGKDGTLWLTNGNAISHFFVEQNVFVNYVNRAGLPGNFSQQRSLREPINDGMPGRDIKEGVFHGKGLRSSSGRIYFGTGQGVVVFHPDSLQENPFVPPVVITGFSIDDKIVPIKGSFADTMTWKTPLHLNISYTKRIVLNHNQNDFAFEFSSMNFVSPENNLYKYRLEPFEKEWIESAAENRVARYTNMNPGKYTFRVIGSNNDGMWNEEGATLVIIITPPWWQTWWAFILYVVAFIVVFLYWRKYENNQLKLKHRAEHLSELDDLKTRFFTNISHEFRTPITLIQGPLKEMYKKATSKEERSMLGIMLRNAQRLSSLINQLLDLSKLDAGKMTLHVSEVELVQFLREIAASYESLAASKKIKYFYYPEVAELMVYIDAEKMEKVIHNLLSNAIKFTNENGEVILMLKSSEKHCHVVVRDTGIGIPLQEQAKIFDRFYQVDSSQSRQYEGSGLGMTLVKEFVELHQGTITLESIEGKGTSFSIRLPLGKEHIDKEHVIERGQVRGNHEMYVESNSAEHIEKLLTMDEHQSVLLIVEDNADMRHYIGRAFSDQYTIAEASNGREGIQKANELIPDLIISDVMMPEMDGYKFCEQIKTNERTSHVPVILLTAKADRESRLLGLETGADDYLAKPFDVEELKVIVRKRIEERRKMRERFSKEITLEPRQIAITSFDEKFLTKVLDIIEKYIADENFSIDQLSREVGYSNMHFYRKIKSLTGETPSQFLRTIRLKRAAELLKKKSDNVTQIAYSVGFASVSYFNKSFKEQFGVTPGQYAEGVPQKN